MNVCPNAISHLFYPVWQHPTELATDQIQSNSYADWLHLLLVKMSDWYNIINPFNAKNMVSHSKTLFFPVSCLRMSFKWNLLFYV
jgi:hypothetical protein